MSSGTIDAADFLSSMDKTSYDLIIMSMEGISTDLLKEARERLKVPIFNLI
jgi:hypothetical protein